MFLKIKEDYLRLSSVDNFRSVPIWIWHKGWTSGIQRQECQEWKKYEYGTLKYNEQEQNLKNFLTHANLSTHAKILLNYNTQAIQAKTLWIHTTLVIFLTHATRIKIWTTPPMLISWPWVTIGKKQGNEHMLYLFSKRLLLAEKKFKIFVTLDMTEVATSTLRSICINP